jgi:hypothetical protein
MTKKEVRIGFCTAADGTVSRIAPAAPKRPRHATEQRKGVRYAVDDTLYQAFRSERIE